MNVVDLARSYIGKVTYTWGSEDIDNGKADCSGFTDAIFSKAGFTIGEDTDSQWTGNGEKISKEELQTGDLVFFKDTYASGHTDGVSHVGIYSGNGNFIHCSSSKGVVESSLNDSYYSNHYLGAKRVNGASTSEVPSTSDSSETSLGLVWWGDIVKVIISGLLLIAGVVMIVVSVKENL